MKRMLAALLSLSLVALSVEPALAASRSLSIPTGAKLAAPLQTGAGSLPSVSVSLPSTSLLPASIPTAGLSISANALPPALGVQAPAAPAPLQAGIEGLAQRLSAEPSRADRALDAAFDGSGAPKSNALGVPASEPAYVKIILRDAALPASEVLDLLSSHGLTPRSRVGRVIEANRTASSTIEDSFLLEKDPRVDAAALQVSAEPAPGLIIQLKDRNISETGAKQLLFRHGVDLERRIDGTGIFIGEAQPGVDSEAAIASLREDPEVKRASIGRTATAAAEPAPSQAKPSVPPAKGSGNRSGAVDVKVVGIIAGVVLTIALVIALFFHRGNQKDKLWSQSPAAVEVVRIEKARRSGDAESLLTISADAQQRAAKLREQIADAKSRRSSKVGELSIKDAEALASFDELAAARGALNANEVSKDSTRRIGRRLPAAWQGDMKELDAEAKATGFEGKLGNELDSLAVEVNAESATRDQLNGRISNFEAQVPGLGGGALKEQRAKARADLAGFDQEISVEQAEHETKLAAARARIFTRLAAGNAEFRGRAGRRDALARVESGAVASADSRAAAVESELKRMADQVKLRDDARKESERLSENAKRFDEEARKLERVEVKTPALDSLGNPMRDRAGNPLYTYKYEDQSGPKKQEAADARRFAVDKQADAERAAQEARNSGVRAARDRDDLDRQVTALREDETLKAEGLESKLPAEVPVVMVYVNHRGWILLDVQDFNFYFWTLTYEQANELRAKFSGVTAQVAATRGAIAQTRDAQARWLAAKVDAELARQKKSGF